MMIYSGRKPYIRLGEIETVERAVFTVWLCGMEMPEEKETAWLEDYLQFVKQRKEARERRQEARSG